MPLHKKDSQALKGEITISRNSVDAAADDQHIKVSVLADAVQGIFPVRGHGNPLRRLNTGVQEGF